jgi:hypothetical protein
MRTTPPVAAISLRLRHHGGCRVDAAVDVSLSVRVPSSGIVSP